MEYAQRKDGLGFKLPRGMAGRKPRAVAVSHMRRARVVVVAVAARWVRGSAAGLGVRPARVSVRQVGPKHCWAARLGGEVGGERCGDGGGETGDGLSQFGP